jgi:prophage antirepressor-like protein
MSEITPFEFPDTGQQVRTGIKNGEPLFTVADVCKILGIGNPSDAARRIHPDDLDTIEVIDSLGRTQNATAVTESGLYDLILDSRKPEARAFRRWITAEVIPSIRKTGSYSATAREITRRDLAQMVIAEADRADQAEARAEVAE